MLRRLLAPALLSATFACEAVAPDESPLEVRTDRSEYTRDPITGLAKIRVTVTNPSGAPAYLSGCPDVPSFVVERQVDGAWQETFQVNVICLAIYTPSAVTLLRGQSRASSNTWDSAGTFRIRVLYGSEPKSPFEHASTGAPFVVR